MALRRYPLLDPSTAIVIGTGDKQRTAMLKPIFETIGPLKAAALLGFHCLTGCDTSGQIRGKGKKSAFKVFSDSSHSVLKALADLGKEESPTTEVINGCEKFIFNLVSKKGTKGKLLVRFVGIALR